MPSWETGRCVRLRTIVRWAHGLVEDVVQSNEDGENAWRNGTPFAVGVDLLGGGSRLSGCGPWRIL